MPNHVDNILDVRGPQEAVEAFQRKVSSDNPELMNHLRTGFEADVEDKKKKLSKGEDRLAKMELDQAISSLKKLDDNVIVLDFNGTVPMPIEVRNTVAGSNLSDEQQARQDSNRKKYGSADWYGWATANWGTKWGAYSVFEVEDIDGGIRYRFNTAWSAPVTWLEKTSEQFPELEFTNTWKSEGGGAGRLIVQAGDAYENEMSEHDFDLEFDEYYRDEYEFINDGPYEEVRDKFMEQNECQYYSLEKYLLERIKNEDLPLFLNFEWVYEGDTFEERCKDCNKPSPRECSFEVAQPRRIRI